MYSAIYTIEQGSIDRLFRFYPCQFYCGETHPDAITFGFEQLDRFKYAIKDYLKLLILESERVRVGKASAFAEASRREARHQGGRRLSIIWKIRCQ